jgi:hypothetical protein
MTIAFSTTSNRWVSRYSFEPAAYFHVDQQLVSVPSSTTPNVTGTSKAWRHDVDNAHRNRFYGNSYNTEFEVVSNNNPSATKNFEAVSLETPVDASWRMDFETIDEEATTTDFEKKENDFYAEVPRTSDLRNSRLIHIGSINAEDFTVEAIQSGEGLKMKTVSSQIVNGPLVFTRADKDLAVLRVNPTGSTSQGGYQAFLDGNSPESGIYCTSYDGRLQVENFTPGLTPPQIELNGQEVVQLYAIDLSSGRPLRGDYLKIKVTAEPKDFELFAINVDHHNTNLDHSLGQNN